MVSVVFRCCTFSEIRKLKHILNVREILLLNISGQDGINLLLHCSIVAPKPIFRPKKSIQKFKIQPHTNPKKCQNLYCLISLVDVKCS